MRNYGNDKKSALQAKSDAQKIAFAPIMFQAAKNYYELLQIADIINQLACKTGDARGFIKYFYRVVA